MNERAADGLFLETPIFRMKRTVVALARELPEDVWRDVRENWNAVAGEVRALRSALAHVLDAIEEANGSVPVEVYEEAMSVLSRTPDA